MMRELTPTDLNMVLRRLPKDLRDLAKNNGLFVAGGFVREVIAGAPVQDIDLFGPSAYGLELLADELAIARAGRLHKTQFACTVIAPPRAPVQFIRRWNYSDPEQLLRELDFTVCQAAVFYRDGGWRSLCSEGFYPDLAARRLVYTFPKREEAAGGSLMRVRKFLARGYNIQASSLAGVVARLMGGVNEGKLQGLITEGRSVEEARHMVLKGLLHEVDPLVVIDNVEPDETEPD